MKRILYSLILALGFSACAPLLAPPKEGIEGVPAWVRRRDREERAIANRQIEAARQRQELRAARAKAEEERLAAEAASKQAELAAELAAAEHAESEGSAVAETVVDTANGSGEGSGATEVATSEPISSGSGEGSGTTEVASSEPVSSGSGEGSGTAEVATSEPISSGSGEGSGTTEVATSEPISSGSGEGSGATEVAKTEPSKTEPVSEGSGATEVAKTEPAKTEPAKTEPAKTEVVTAEPEVVPVAPRRERDVQTLGVVQTLGRAGSYFIPEKLSGEVPLLILFHGPGDSGALIAEPFVDQARSHGFAILAIDAVNKENSVWAFEVNAAIVHRTKELQFLAKAMEWMTQTQGVTFDKSKTLVAGYSQGASIAAWVGTNERFVSHFGLLHGGFLSDGIGYEVRPVWLSTGDTDDFRTPVIHASTARALRLLGLKDLTSRVFTTDTSLSKEECESLIGWWLGLPAAPVVAPPAAPAK
jgi:predicted esterase